MPNRSHIYFIASLIMWHCSLHPTVIVRGDNSCSPFGFTSAITAQVFNRTTGSFFVGVHAPTNGTYSLARADRQNFTSTPRFVPLALNPAVTQQSIEFLAFSPQINSNNILPFVIGAPNSFSTTEVSTSFDDGTVFDQTPALNDAQGNTSGGIVNIAASPTAIFAALRSSADNFGVNESGIEVINITCLNNGPTFYMLQPQDAQTGLVGNRAQLLNNTSPTITGGTSPVTFDNDPQDINQVALFYDEHLERLYIGLRFTVSPTGIGKSVAVGYIHNGLTLIDSAPNSAISPANSGVDEIIVTNNTTATDSDMRARFVRVLHASSGPSYLIVQGGLSNPTTPTDTASNTLYALPLVDVPTDASIHGTLANKAAPLVDTVFVTPATAPGDLATPDDVTAFIGAGPLPITATTAISDLVIVGDGVFVSTAISPSAVNDTGIFYSQAQFAADGKIARWTPWVKRASPFIAFDIPLTGNASDNGSVSFFDVDPQTGNIWVVDGVTNQSVGLTSWSTTGTSSASLVNVINTHLSQGSYSVLDLNQDTRGFSQDSQAPLSRYALFGGVGSVLFTRISEAENQNLDSPQTVILNFDTPDNTLFTPLPIAGCVTTIEYSRRLSTEGSSNYFFAGTDKGLFAFADTNGNGFTSSSLDVLTAAPFAQRFWQAIPLITGSIIAVKTSGQALYILTGESTPTRPFNNTLYRIPFTTNLTTMFVPASISTIAQTGQPPFTSTLLFSDIAVVSTGDTASDATALEKEQIVLTTNQGLYISAADQTATNPGVSNALTAAQANWIAVPKAETTFYTGIGFTDTKIKNTVWPVSVQDENGLRTFDRSSIEQYNVTGETDTSGDVVVDFSFTPTFFNAAIDDSSFNTLPPISYFFSDGGRRWALSQSANESPFTNALFVLPFDTEEAGVTLPAPLNNPITNRVNQFYWIRTIGTSGFVMAGTDKGVVALQ